MGGRGSAARSCFSSSSTASSCFSSSSTEGSGLRGSSSNDLACSRYVSIRGVANKRSSFGSSPLAINVWRLWEVSEESAKGRPWFSRFLWFHQPRHLL
ncbi:hypothetical protein LOK49_LG09G00927 [Camellia lanceoleosa]|uniref:Uncharacterized protein n=1 Tax=Camellia lanceoleosa TaxID=1840588 RepID=A0ACC0GGR0_9ERIC|nr:hypothetical protein LOK49_LG09G00927 [Camellia lanceoleosa]